MVCLGVNEVSRALEKNQLCLVLCCNQVQPQLVVKHLPYLCYLRNIPLCTLSLPTSPFRLGRIFGVRTTLAVGFKVRTRYSLIPAQNPLL
jgi:ribonucleases P/MRP protein subunit RPP38